MWRCTVCSFSNEDSTSQCGRCQIKKNPGPRNPWGLRKGRHATYWSNYDWDAGNHPDFPNGADSPRTITQQHQHHNTNVHDRITTKLQSRDNLQRGPRPVTQPYPYYPPTISSNKLETVEPSEEEEPEAEETDESLIILPEAPSTPLPPPPSSVIEEPSMPELIRDYGRQYSVLIPQSADGHTKPGSCGLFTQLITRSRPTEGLPTLAPPQKSNGYRGYFVIQTRLPRPGEVWSLRNKNWRKEREITKTLTPVVNQAGGNCFA